MQLRVFCISVFCSSLFCSLSARADFYAGINLSNTTVDIEEQNVNFSGDNILIQAQVGYFFNDYIALEARYGTAIRRQDNFLLDNQYSAYLKGNMPITNRTSMYALVGTSRIELDGFNGKNIAEDGMSFGVGVHYALNKNTAVTLEFTNITSSINDIENNEVSAKAINLGFQYRF